MLSVDELNIYDSRFKLVKCLKENNHEWRDPK